MAVSLVSTLGNLVPYITVAELKASPIYNQLKNLVPGASDADRDAELNLIIRRVSAMINGEVNQNLAATVDTEMGRVRLTNRGDLRLHTRSNPIIDVLSVSIGTDPASLTPIADLSSLVFDPWRITIPDATGNPALNLPNMRGGSECWARWVYINGYPATVLATAATAGDTSITVTDATGVLANQTLMVVQDGRRLEQFVPTAVAGNILTVPPMMFAHLAGTGVSAVPEDVKETAMLLISRLHDTWSLSMNAVSMDGVGATKPSAGPLRSMCEAANMLAPYRRTW